MNTAHTIIFTDGSSRGNPGPGGWGAVVVRIPGDGLDMSHAEVTELGGRESHTTNNRMELMATIAGLLGSAPGLAVEIRTDSMYIINGITKWIHGWVKNGWRTKDRKDVLNKDLWLRLADAAQDRDITWKHVSGHVGIAGNERCDEIATSFADGKDPGLYKGPLAVYPIFIVF